ncbi:site-specific integrase [Bacillus sp. ISL-53]|nr:site-specific integrase [Bacillus sp. ISL-53]
MAYRGRGEFQTSLKVKIEDFEEFNEFNDSSFNLENSIEIANQILLEMIKEQNLDSFDFSSSEWKFINRSKQFTYFNFEELKNIVKFHSHIREEEFVQIAKCWIVTNLDMKTVYGVKNSFTTLMNFLQSSQSFLYDEELIEDIGDRLQTLAKSERYWICVYMLNFINFHEDIDPDGLYGQMLRDVKNTVSYKDLENVRILPSTKDLIFFHTIINSYFDQLSEADPNYYRFFPLALWWRLTTVIPLRPFEFCTILRDGIFEKNGEYYIHLPRSEEKGNKNKNNVQIIKDIAISEDMYQFIQTYIEKTEQFGETKTLISYKAVEWANELLGQRARNEKIDKEHFTYRILYTLLDNFYSEVVFEVFNLTFNPIRKKNENKGNEHKKFRELLNKVLIYSDENYHIDRMVSLGDTRHIALMNLQRLGYHPVEMARLAGHANLSTQYSYHSHQQNWVDTEVLKLMTTFKFEKREHSRIQKRGFVGWEVKDEFDVSHEWRDKFLLNPTKFGSQMVKNKLKLGYCTDEYQRCQVNDCAEGCEFWRISKEEFDEKKDIIKEKIKKAEKRLHYVVMSLIDLHKYAISNRGDPDVSVDNFQFNQKLLQKSGELDELVHRLAELMAIEERKMVDE